MRQTIAHGCLALLFALLGCDERASPPPVEPSTPAEPNVPTLRVACSPDAVREVADAFQYLSADQHGAFFAKGVLELCEGPIPPEARALLQQLQGDGLVDPDRCAALPPKVDGFVPRTELEASHRSSLELAYARMSADCRHTQGIGFRWSRQDASSAPRVDDVELGIHQSGLRFRGRVLPETATLASVLPPATPQRRLVFAVDRDHPWNAVSAHWEQAKQAGYSQFGLLGQTEKMEYRVTSFRISSGAGKPRTAVGMNLDGFVLDRGGGQRPLCSLLDASPMVPLAKPGADLADEERWDFVALRALLARESPRPTDLVLFADGEIRSRDVVRFAETVRAALCRGEETQCPMTFVEAC